MNVVSLVFPYDYVLMANALLPWLLFLFSGIVSVHYHYNIIIICDIITIGIIIIVFIIDYF